MSNKAVIYARYSSERQTELSIDAQLTACKQFAIEQNLSIINEYIDRAYTGKNDNRPAFQKMLKDSAKKEFEYVLVYKLDRFARNRYDSAINKRTLKKNGVKVLSAKEQITDTPEGIILESLLEGMNEYYSVELAQKIKANQFELIQKHRYLGGPLPFGLKIVNGQFDIDLPKAQIIQKVFQDYADGVSLDIILQYMKDNNVKNNIKTFYNKKTIYYVLSNEKYIGRYKWGKDYDFEDYIPPIISKQLFWRVQEMIKNKKRASAIRNSNYLLAGKLFCGLCGEMINPELGTSHTGKKYYYYKCGKQKRTKNCTQKIFKKELLEDKIFQKTKEKIFCGDIDKLAASIVAYYNKSLKYDDLELYKTNLKKVEKEIANIVNAIKQGILTMSTKDELLKLEQEKEIIKELIAEQELKKSFELTIEKVRFMLEKFFINSDNEKTKEIVLRNFVDKVVMFPDTAIISFKIGNISNEQLTVEEMKALFLNNEKTEPEQKFGFGSFGSSSRT